MSVHLLTGDDESLLSSALSDLVHRLVGDGDRSLMVDDFDGADYELTSVADAAQTLPFLTDRRVVVARGIGRFTADDVAPLVSYLADPLDSTELVLVTGGGRVPKALTDALKAAGATVTDTSPPTRAKERSGWVEERVTEAGLHLDGQSLAALTGWMGEDAGRLTGLLDTLVSAFGTTQRLRFPDIEPFLGEAGGVPPWDLTDAIDRGETTKALTLLARMTSAGGRHPLQVMAVLHGHYTKMLKLDGADARSEDAAAAVLGVKPGYAVKKVMEQQRKLGADNVNRAVAMLAQADLDLRGQKEWPETLVMEVLVARLSKLSPAGRR
jgi:DNA polymerase III subunit delta